jgi:hypothetical protein
MVSACTVAVCNLHTNLVWNEKLYLDYSVRREIPTIPTKTIFVVHSCYLHTVYIGSGNPRFILLLGSTILVKFTE